MSNRTWPGVNSEITKIANEVLTGMEAKRDKRLQEANEALTEIETKRDIHLHEIDRLNKEADMIENTMKLIGIGILIGVVIIAYYYIIKDIFNL